MYCNMKKQTRSNKHAVYKELLWGDFIEFVQGIARTQSPTNINYAPESPTFGVIAEVNPPGVQWTGLALGEPP